MYLCIVLGLYLCILGDCLCVDGLRIVSTSPAFMRSRASHSAGPHDRLTTKTVNRPPLMGVWGGGGWCGFDTICTAVCHNCCDSYHLYAVSIGTSAHLSPSVSQK